MIMTKIRREYSLNLQDLSEAIERDWQLLLEFKHLGFTLPPEVRAASSVAAASQIGLQPLLCK